MICTGSYQRVMLAPTIGLYRCAHCAQTWEKRALAGEHKLNAPGHSPTPARVYSAHVLARLFS